MKTLIRSVLTLLAAIAALGAGPALAKNVIADIDQIAEVMKAAGYKAEIKGSKGDRYISSGASGYNFSILPFGCDDSGANCKSVQFYVAFNPKTSPTLDAMNVYARENRWGRIYLDKDGDPAIEYDLDLEVGGMSEELFLDNVAYWESIMSAFGKFVFGKE